MSERSKLCRIWSLQRNTFNGKKYRFNSLIIHIYKIKIGKGLRFGYYSNSPNFLDFINIFKSNSSCKIGITLFNCLVYSIILISPCNLYKSTTSERRQLSFRSSITFLRIFINKNSFIFFVNAIFF